MIQLFYSNISETRIVRLPVFYSREKDQAGEVPIFGQKIKTDRDLQEQYPFRFNSKDPVLPEQDLVKILLDKRNLGEQHDFSEYYLLMLPNVTGVEQEDLVRDLFHVRLLSKHYLPDGARKHTLFTEECYFRVFRSHNTLEKAIDDMCFNRTKRRTTFSFEKLPIILGFNIMNGIFRSFNILPVQIPDILYMDRYLTKNFKESFRAFKKVIKQEGGSNSDSQMFHLAKNFVSPDDTKTLEWFESRVYTSDSQRQVEFKAHKEHPYVLHAAICFGGNDVKGHYWIYIKMHLSRSNNWVRYDDRSVQVVSQQEADNEIQRCCVFPVYIQQSKLLEITGM